jgi:hypothetical protein
VPRVYATSGGCATASPGTSLGTFPLELAVAVDVDDRSVSPKLGHHPVMLLAEIDALAAQGAAGLPALLERVWPATSSSLHQHPLPRACSIAASTRDTERAEII